MRPEEIVELVGNIANRSDIREAQSKQVQAIYDLLAVRERETWEAAAVAVGYAGGGRSAYSYRDEFLQNASCSIQVTQDGRQPAESANGAPSSVSSDTEARLKGTDAREGSNPSCPPVTSKASEEVCGECGLSPGFVKSALVADELAYKYKKLAEDNWSRYRNLLAWLPKEQQKEALAVVDTFCPPGGTLPDDAAQAPAAVHVGCGGDLRHRLLALAEEFNPGEVSRPAREEKSLWIAKDVLDGLKDGGDPTGFVFSTRYYLSEHVENPDDWVEFAAVASDDSSVKGKR